MVATDLSPSTVHAEAGSSKSLVWNLPIQTRQTKTDARAGSVCLRLRGSATRLAASRAAASAGSSSTVIAVTGLQAATPISATNIKMDVLILAIMRAIRHWLRSAQARVLKGQTNEVRRDKPRMELLFDQMPMSIEPKARLTPVGTALANFRPKCM